MITNTQIQAAEKRMSIKDILSAINFVKGKTPAELEPERFQIREATIKRVENDAAKIGLERVLGANDLIPISYFDQGVHVQRSVCKINVRDANKNTRGYGTGFMISRSLMMTNNHVFEDAASAENSLAEFNYQFDANGVAVDSVLFSLDPAKFFFTSKDLDFSIVAVKDTSDTGNRPLAQFGFLKLNRIRGKSLLGECLTIVQHPNGERKQVAMRENKLIKLIDNFIWYETDTSPGSSGSPVFNDSWQVVALHHSGIPARDDQGRILTIKGTPADDTTDDTKIKWIANEGVRASTIVDTLEQNFPANPFVKEILDSATSFEVTGGNPTPAGAGGGSNGSAPQVQRQADDRTAVINTNQGGLHLRVPLNISISVGNAENTQSASLTHSDGQFEAITIDPDYNKRTGYKDNFLSDSKKVPLPKLTNKMLQNTAVNKEAKGKNKHVLNYYNFSVVVNKGRRLAYFTAVNIDGKQGVKIKRESDKWFYDPRIGRDEQVGEEIYTANELDRGHLVRRLDPAWGKNQKVAKVANDDTFHFTNCSPQHKNFNQNKTTWAGLEDYILFNSQNHKLKVCVFTGPVFTDDDMEYRGVNLPSRFWKVVTMLKDDGKLSATAYLLTQEKLIANLEEFNFGAYKTFQVTVKEIEKLTGLDFGNLSKHDPKSGKSKTGTNEAFEVTAAREISSPNEIIL